MAMNKKDMELIVKKYYEGLAEGKVLGRRCTKCGHIELPPFLVCNNCGCFDTEWVEVSGKGVAVEFIPQSMRASNADLNNRFGSFLWALVQPEGGELLDIMNTVVLGVGQDRYEELRAKLPVPVKTKIVEMDGYHQLFWELDEGGCEEPVSEIDNVVLSAARDAYRSANADIQMDTYLRRDVSNDSMYLLAFLSSIENELNVLIPIGESSDLKTVQDYADKVKELLEN